MAEELTEIVPIFLPLPGSMEVEAFDSNEHKGRANQRDLPQGTTGFYLRKFGPGKIQIEPKISPKNGWPDGNQKRYGCGW